MRVASLLRLSTKNQALRQGNGEADIPAQRQEIESFLSTRPDWTMVKEYVEAGVSAFKKSRFDRDVLQDVFRDAEARVFDALIVWKADRLSRRIQDFPGIIADLCDMGLQVWSVVDAPGGKQWSAENALAVFMLSVEGYKNQVESENISIRTSTRKRQLVAEGKHVGGTTPFGYMLEQVKDASGNAIIRYNKIVRRVVPHPENAQIVRELYRRYVNGEGYTSLVAWMNTIGVPPARGAAWSRQVVSSILMNPFYTGHLSYLDKRNKATEPIIARGEHEPIVEEAIWREAQEVRVNRTHLPKRQRRGDYCLSGILRCGLCGARMGGTTSKYTLANGTPVDYPMYRCSGRKNYSTCTMHTVAAREAEAAFVKAVAGIGHPEQLRSFFEQEAKADGDRLKEYQAARKAAQDRLKKIEQAIGRIDKAFFETATLTERQYKERLTRYEAERTAVQSELAKPAPAVQAKDVSGLLAMVQNIERLWARATSEKRKTIAMSVLAAWNRKAVIFPDRHVELQPE